MKMSEYLRKFQAEAELPQVGEDTTMLAYWAGVLIGSTRKYSKDHDKAIDAAIRCAEFIESVAK